MRGAPAPGRHARSGRIADDDPRKLRLAWTTRFFTRMMARKMGRDFSGVRGSGAALAPRPAWRGRPLVLYANHPSWWDPAFLSVLVARLAPGRPVYAPIDAAALARYPFMRRCGLFGIEPGTRSGARRFLDVGARVLAQPATVLCVTPQGGFVDARARPLQLQRGLAVLLARCPGAVVVPVGFDYPFWNESRPEALARIGEPVRPPADAPADAAAWQRALRAGLTTTLDDLMNDSLARDPGRFVTVLEGRAGVGGVYDAWRRATALLRGRGFDPRHALPRRAPGP